ncbi:AsmA family protein [Motilimonas eburnea]|uniref:AsmA family protein n=1 Tax=Motilimonas eburnea TaxID=1737488 RepID=UPI001E6584D4|nr:AsmA family protein [Motilimonas eburnea]MCE2571082.1 AsmA family protein [Motilimonas eburnea]
MPDQATANPQAKRHHKIWRWLGLIFASLTLLITLLGVFLWLVQPTINLTRYNADFAALANQQLEHPISIQGDTLLQLSLTPHLTVNQISIANPAPYPDQLAKLEQAEIALALIPLLSKQIQFNTIKVTGLTTNLFGDQQQNNWQWLLASQQTSDAPTAPSDWRLTQLGHIAIHDVTINHQRDADTFIDYRLDQLTFGGDQQQDIRLDAKGSFAGLPYHVSLLASPQAQQSPYQLKIDVAGIKSEFNGTFDRHTHQGQGQFSLTLKDDTYLAPLFGANIKPLLPLNFAAEISNASKQVEMMITQMQLGGTQLDGQAKINWQPPLPVITGQLHGDSINLNHWLEPPTDTSPSGPAAERQTQPTPQKSKVDRQIQQEQQALLQRLRYYFSLLEGNISFSLDELTGLGTSIKDARLKVRLKQGKFTVPAKVTIAKVPFSGRITLQATDTIKAKVNLKAKNAEIGDLAKLFLGASSVKGQVESSVLKINSKGHNLLALVQNAKLNYQLKQAHLQYGTPNPVHFSVHNAEFVSGSLLTSTLNVDGQLLGVPVTIKGEGEPTQQLAKGEPWQVSLKVSAPHSHLSLAGGIQQLGQLDGSKLTLNAEIQQLGALASWFAIDPSSRDSISLAGQLKGVADHFELDLDTLKLGQTQGRAHLYWQPDQDNAYVKLSSHFARINLAQMSRMTHQPNKPVTPQTGLTLSAPILPSEIKIMDADLELKIDRLNSQTLNFNNIILNGKIRDGWLKQAPFGVTLGSNRFNGDISVDLRHFPPQASFALTSKQTDIGEIARLLKLSDELDLHADQLSLRSQVKGDNIQAMLLSAKLNASVQGGLWRLPSKRPGQITEIELSQGSLSMERDKDSLLTLEGKLLKQPVQLSLRAPSLRASHNSKQPLPIQLNAQLNQIKLAASSRVSLPISTHNLQLALQLDSPTLAEIQPLIPIDLPHFGPVHLQANLHTDAVGYYLDQVRLQLSNSHLAGKMALLANTTTGKPQFDLSLHSPQIQLNDFRDQNWRLFAASNPPSSDAKVGQSAPISPATFQRLDANIKLKVDKVVSGQDHLGQGQLDFNLTDGNAELQRLQLEIPGGNVVIKSGLNFNNGLYNSWVDAQIDKLDYGVLANRIEPNSKIKGELSLDLAVKGSAPKLTKLLNQADGHVRFAIHPQSFKADIFDLWAVSLVSALLPKVTDEDHAEVNCLVGRFNLNQGVLTQERVLLDSTRMQAFGEVQIDLNRRDVNIKLTPRAKRAQIFALQTPIQVKGKIEDFKVGIAPGGLIGTTLRFITSPVVAPLKWMLETPVNNNGQPQCQQAWQGDVN